MYVLSVCRFQFSWTEKAQTLSLDINHTIFSQNLVLLELSIVYYENISWSNWKAGMILI